MYVVIYEDRFGRALHGVTNDWQHTLYQLHEHERDVVGVKKTRKRLAHAEVYQIAERVR